MNKDKRITIRFTEKEWSGIAHRAALEDLPIGEYLRRMIDKGERAKSTDLTW